MQSVDRAGLEAEPVRRFVHGTTVVTNLLLERAGARVVLLATAGFSDLLWLRRQERASLYDLTCDQPAPLVRDGDVIAVPERVAPRWFDGAARREAPDDIEVVTALTDEEVARVVDRRTGQRGERVRDRAAARARRIPRTNSACTTHCAPRSPRPRSPPRTTCSPRSASTNAPRPRWPRRTRVRRCVGTCSRSSGRSRGAASPTPRVMTSAGGTLAAAVADTRAASLALSGPAGGVTAAAALCRAHGRARRAHHRHRRHVGRRGAHRARRAAHRARRRARRRADRAAARAGGDRGGRRRQPRARGRGWRAAGRPRERGRRAGAGLLRSRRARRRPSPTRTWCSGTSARARGAAAVHISTASRARGRRAAGHAARRARWRRPRAH